MASEFHPIKEQEINDLYTNVSTGTFHNRLENLKTFVSDFGTSLEAVETKETQLQADVDAFVSEISNFQTDKEQVLDNIELAWGKKKAIAAGFKNGQPDYEIWYPDLSNDDFAAGSICFIISN